MIMQYAVGVGAWQASRYLLNYGAPQPVDMDKCLSWRTCRREKSASYVTALLEHDLNDAVRMSCLVACRNDLDSFTDLVGRLWPNNEFYTADFERTRLGIAAYIAMYSVTRFDEMWRSHSPAVFQHLCGSSSLTQAGIITTMRVLSCITWALGVIVWCDSDVANKWYGAIRDTALRLDRSLMMPKRQLLGLGMIQSDTHHLPTSTPFTDMFLASMVTAPSWNSRPKWTRQHRIRPRLASCERAVQMWLNIIRECGIDLLEYGRQENKRLKDEEKGYEFTIWRDTWDETSRNWEDLENGRFEVRLIGFEYGSEPGDWKLWWSEPTDALVGDFWREVEPEPLWIPGSWGEDF